VPPGRPLAKKISTQGSTLVCLIAFLISTFCSSSFRDIRGLKFTLGCAVLPGRPLAEQRLYLKRVYFVISIFLNFNFLALVLSAILGGLKFTLGALCPLDAPSGKILVPNASTLVYLMAFLISAFLLQ